MSRLATALLCLVFASLFISCEGGSATETTGGSKVVGLVYYPDGTPATGATITVRNSKELQDTLKLDDTTQQVDAIVSKTGRYSLESLSPGDYILDIRDNRGNHSLLEFEKGSGTKSDLSTVILRKAGALRGSMGLLAGMPDRGWIAVYGLGKVTRADSAGKFSIQDLPAGRLFLKATSAKPNWGYTDTLSATILAGETTSLPAFTPILNSSETYSDWKYSKPVVINTKIASIKSDIHDFPIMLRLHSANFNFTQSKGHDLRFASTDGRHLAYAIEKWDSTANLAVVWVTVDLIKGNSSSPSFWMYWGNPNVTAGSYAPAVFATFAGVWHLSESGDKSGAGIFQDASPSQAHGTGMTQPGITQAIIAEGQTFQGNHAITLSDSPRLLPTKAVTLSAWIRALRTDSLGSEILSLGGSYGLRLNPLGHPQFFITTDSLPDKNNQPADEFWELTLKAVDLRDSLWHHLAATYDGAFLRVYLDGNERVSTQKTGDLVYLMNKNLSIGQHGNGTPGYNFIGSLDEIEVTAGLRTPEWIDLSYQNQKPGSVLVEYP